MHPEHTVFRYTRRFKRSRIYSSKVNVTLAPFSASVARVWSYRNLIITIITITCGFTKAKWNHLGKNSVMNQCTSTTLLIIINYKDNELQLLLAQNHRHQKLSAMHYKFSLFLMTNKTKIKTELCTIQLMLH